MNFLESTASRKREYSLINLLYRTFSYAIDNTGINYKDDLLHYVKVEFNSATFAKQISKILNSLIRATLNTTPVFAASEEFYTQDILTAEAVKKASQMSSNAANSIIRMLDDDAIYYTNSKQLSRKIREYWGNDKYAAERFARTTVADIYNATIVHKYRAEGHQYMEFSSSSSSAGKHSRAVCSICEALNGTIFDLKGQGSENRPPLHHNCRCTMVPVPITQKIDPSMLYENRDFESMFEDKEHYEKAFANLDKFNSDYRIDQFVLDEHLQQKYLKQNFADKAVSFKPEYKKNDAYLFQPK